MTPWDFILTHPGSSHKDEFLACAVLLAQQPVRIERREPSAEDLANPAVCVVDVGHCHEPELNNFDHHQFPPDHPPCCSLSLVLKKLDLYEDARTFCSWLETTEWFDSKGPNQTANWLGVEREVLHKLNSPLDITLLRRFAQAKTLLPGEPLWEVMRLIGSDLIEYLQSLRARLAFIEQKAEFWTLGNAETPALFLFLPRTEPLPEEPSQGIDLFIERRNLKDTVVGLVYPDRRGEGYGLSRFRDNTRLDFTKISQHPQVHFAHARGFVAKTSATEKDELQELLRQSLS
jgi:hypothetical protein